MTPENHSPNVTMIDDKTSYWLQVPLTAHYERDGTITGLFRAPGPHHIYARAGARVSLDPELSVWILERHLGLSPPAKDQTLQHIPPAMPDNRAPLTLSTPPHDDTAGSISDTDTDNGADKATGSNGF